MARTISPDYDKRRDAIVEKAARLYARHGFLGASVADLAKACKMSKSLIYHYYPSKEDILFAVMSAHLDELSDVLANSTDKGTPREQLHVLTRGFMAKYVGAAASQKVLLNELDNLPADKRPAIVDQQRRIIKEVEKLLCGIVPALTGEQQLQRPIAMLFFGMINWTHNWYDPKGAVSSARLADLAVELFVNGLKKLKPQDYAS